MQRNYNSWACGNFLVSWPRQRDNVIEKAQETRKKWKHIKVSVSRGISHNEKSNNAITNNIVAWKHGHVVAAVLSRARLCQLLLHVHKLACLFFRQVREKDLVMPEQGESSSCKGTDCRDKYKGRNYGIVFFLKGLMIKVNNRQIEINILIKFSQK